MQSSNQHAAQIVSRLAGQRVLVVGDLMLDEYLVGQAVGLSREAPVPILEQTQSFSIPGGACNPARNMVALGAEAGVIGVVGDDPAGDKLREQLGAAGVDTSGVVVDSVRPTTTKTRLMAESALRQPQHLARLDRVERRPVTSDLAISLLDRLEALAPACDAILVSHYRSGVATPELVDRVRQLSRQHGAWSTVDAQANLGRFAGFDLLKCNRAEAEEELGDVLQGDADFERALVRLVPRLGVANMVVTRGAQGMSALAAGQTVLHSPAVRVSDIYDVVGAGDTVIAVLTLALCGGLSLSTATHLANAAAGLVVRRLGNATVTSEQLIDALGGNAGA